MSNVIKLSFDQLTRTARVAKPGAHPKAAASNFGQATRERSRGRPRLDLTPTRCQGDFEEIAEAIKRIDHHWPAAKEEARLLADEDPRLNGSCISVLNLLLAEIDRRTGVVRPSPPKYAAHMRCCRRSVTNALARLEDCGLILRRPATDSGRQAEVTLPCFVTGAARAEMARKERLKQREGRAKGDRKLDERECGKNEKQFARRENKLHAGFVSDIKNARKSTGITEYTDDLIGSQGSADGRKISSATMDQARKLYLGLDIDHLASKFLAWEGSRCARNIDAAFLGWLRKVIGKPRQGNVQCRTNERHDADPNPRKQAEDLLAEAMHPFECTDPELADRARMFQRELLTQCGPAIVINWFSKFRIEGVEGQVLTLSLAESFIVKWIANHYPQELSRAANIGFGVDEIHLVSTKRGDEALRVLVIEAYSGGRTERASTP